MMRVLVVGATSAIAEATARRYAAAGAHLHLVGRDATRLGAIADDLRVRGAAAVATTSVDLDRLPEAERAVVAAVDSLGGIDLALVAHGTLPDQAGCDAESAPLLAQFTTNALSPITLLAALARHPGVRAGATLAVISSVAGDRGRASNHAYGAAKAAVSTYASGLGQALAPRGIHVLTVKPGFVDTPMTRAFRKGVLWARPDAIAGGIVRAVARRRAVAYLPWFWRPILLVIRALPEFVFRRVKL